MPRRINADPDPGLVELTDLLAGTWRVTGPGIEGVAEYQSRKDGHLLVTDVDFAIGESRMKVMQHISHDPGSGALRARYMDSMGDEATYEWALRDGTLRVSLVGDTDTYFLATLDEDRSRYVGTWHYADGSPEDPAEVIVYTRVPSA